MTFSLCQITSRFYLSHLVYLRVNCLVSRDSNSCSLNYSRVDLWQIVMLFNLFGLTCYRSIGNDPRFI